MVGCLIMWATLVISTIYMALTDQSCDIESHGRFAVFYTHTQTKGSLCDDTHTHRQNLVCVTTHTDKR